MNKSIHFFSRELTGEIHLPASKSISNRVLIINALSNSDKEVENLSACDDTDAMRAALSNTGSTFDVGHAGTAMRFLTACLAQRIGTWVITGSERMKQRPISVLVDALRKLGAQIEYLEKEGFPPLQISGTKMTGGALTLSASVSSQYISALMMIAPLMKNGLKLTLADRIVSRTYIDMTVGMMAHFGVHVIAGENEILVPPHPYKPVYYRVESDWSAASYFYELLAIADSGEIHLPGLLRDSLQGDACQVAVWEQLGVTTHFAKDDVTLTKSQVSSEPLIQDFIMMPDLVQSFAVACCVTGHPFAFTGVETLRIKETDRLNALVVELAKLGYQLEIEGDGKIIWEGKRCAAESRPIIGTWNDHRMAMAFAPAALVHTDLVIEDAGVVSKSFPTFWDALEKFAQSTDE